MGGSCASRPKLGDYFRPVRSAGKPGLPLMSVTMRDGLVPRADLERRTETNLTDREHISIEPGDLAYNTMRMWQGAFGIAAEAANVSPAYVVMRPTDRMASRFAWHWLKSDRALYQLWAYSYGLTDDRLRLYAADFGLIPLAPPPLPEQRRIAAVLDAWDEAIALSERLVAAKRRRRDGVAQRLLTGNRRSTRLLGEFVTINPRASKGRPNSTVSFVGMEDVTEDGRLARHVPRDRADLGNGYTPFEDGDVLVARITPCFENGKGAHVAALHGGIGFGSTEFHVLRARPGILPRFVYYHTRTGAFRRNGERMMSGSAGQQRVPAEFIEDYRLPVPPMDIQERAVRALDALTDEIDLLAARTDLLRSQKRGLMQRLLTGALRVPESLDALMPAPPPREAAE